MKSYKTYITILFALCAAATFGTLRSVSVETPIDSYFVPAFHMVLDVSVDQPAKVEAYLNARWSAPLTAQIVTGRNLIDLGEVPGRISIIRVGVMAQPGARVQFHNLRFVADGRYLSAPGGSLIELGTSDLAQWGQSDFTYDMASSVFTSSGPGPYLMTGVDYDLAGRLGGNPSLLVAIRDLLLSGLAGGAVIGLLWIILFAIRRGARVGVWLKYLDAKWDAENPG